MKIEILSPVHIGTGSLVNSICYKEVSNSNIVNCYDFSDIAKMMSPKVLLNDEKLKNLSQGNCSRKDVNDLLSTANYSNIQPLYSLKSIHALNNHDTYEQVKSLGKPYIPGSSIKGAVMHCILYHFIKENFNKIDFENIVLNSKTIKDVFSALCNNKEFYVKMANCLVCRDVYFDDLILLTGKRVHPEYNLDIEINCEAIEEGQEKEQEIIGIVDKEIVQCLTSKFDSSMCKKMLEYLNVDKIMEAIQTVFEDNMEIELNTLVYKQKDIDELNRIKSRKNEFDCILRVGRFTTLFEKSIAHLLEKVNFQSFKTKKLKVDNPKTRMLFSNDEDHYLTGYIGIKK